MPALPLILLPPSEGKAKGGSGAPWASGSLSVNLDASRFKIATALVKSSKWSADRRSKLLGVKGEALAAATSVNAAVLDSPSMPAIDRYTGVLYEALDWSSLRAAEQRRLEQSVLIFSGLWGLVAPSDAVPDYKIKMGASLPRVGKLSTMWAPHVTGYLCDVAEGRTIWNLLPNEHDAAWRPPSSTAQYRVKFLERRPSGKLVAVAHWNKLLKGALVRFLAANPSADAAALGEWEHPLGYRLDPDRTETNEAGTTLFLVTA